MSSANPENASLSIPKGTVSGSFGTLALQIQARRGSCADDSLRSAARVYAIIAAANPASSASAECPSGSGWNPKPWPVFP
jgi:hypothetical protein